MNRLFLATTMVVAFLMAGCHSGELDEMKKNLGPFQYVGLDPQLSFSLAEVELRPPRNEYSSPEVRYTLNIKQNNQNFPLKKYLVIVSAEVVDSQGNKRDQIVATGTVENGVVSLSDVHTLYGLKVKDQGDLNSMKMQVESYTWSPEVKHKPYQADAETKNR